METNFLSSGKSMLLFEAFFLLLETMIEIRRNQFLQKFVFLLVEIIFNLFCQKRQFFRILETYFSTNALFQVVEPNFMASTNHKLFFRHKLVFWRTLHFSYWRKIFSLVETAYFAWEFSPTSQNRHWYEWKSVFKDRPCSC